MYIYCPNVKTRMWIRVFKGSLYITFKHLVPLGRPTRFVYVLLW